MEGGCDEDGMGAVAGGAGLWYKGGCLLPSLPLWLGTIG